ncbi:hypothetical protein MRX96_039675 [Rhipicephalus microplus]
MGYDLRSRLDNAVPIPPSPVYRFPLDGGAAQGASLGALAGGTPRRAPTRSGIARSPSIPALRRSGRQPEPPDHYSP